MTPNNVAGLAYPARYAIPLRTRRELNPAPRPVDFANGESQAPAGQGPGLLQGEVEEVDPGWIRRLSFGAGALSKCEAPRDEERDENQNNP